MKTKPSSFQKEKTRLNRVADWYDPSYQGIESIMINYRLDVMMPKIKGPNVLEMGCSTGVMTKRLVKKFPALTVVDGSRHYIDYVKNLLKSNKCKFFVSLFEDFKPQEKFDDIIMANILEHVNDPINILQGAKKWLKKNGRIHILVPNAKSLHRRIGKELGIIKKLDDFSELDKKIEHRRVYTEESLRKDVSKAGLKTVFTEGIFLKPLSQAQISNWGKKVLDAFLKVGEEFPDEYCSTIYLICTRR
jgi:2-polyprenyl-3-methyl-5-hydroxy-6-metoxy-1,4-benzoquinol methylase